ncbi:MAG: hypothetical protein C7B43_15370 [Sulfobacillus benefaciens]|uniref:Fido domain-containing protein n=1 Tax=Sulfobacillus benefaciens TaxID=453960 RepID=A0A2T2WUT3_9FIRM|nr:MAG: hypothetical protein C7B43_15370 [Sulfobacillus benefaciens]
MTFLFILSMIRPLSKEVRRPYTKRQSCWNTVSPHRLTRQGILHDRADQYRTDPVFIRGSRHVPPNPLRVPDAMTDFIAQFAHRPQSLHPVVFGAQAHIQLAAIHSFVDGNGRVSRFLVNGLLLRDGDPPGSYPATSRAEYLITLERAQPGQPRTTVL